MKLNARNKNVLRSATFPCLSEYALYPYKEASRPVEIAVTNYDWPGNVRELRNVAERAVLLSSRDITKETIQEILGHTLQKEVLDDLPKSLDFVLPLKEYRRQLESRYIGHVLNLAAGSITRTAQVLGLDRSHLHQKIKDLG